MGTKAKMTISRAVSILNREKPVFLEGLSPAEVQMVVAKASFVSVTLKFPGFTA